MKLKNEYGSIAVYTRSHIGNCKFTETEQNTCSCPKWLYSNRRGEGFRPERSAAGTPSYAEACRMAQTMLDSWDAKNQRIAELEAQKARTEITVETAVLKYLADVEERLGKNATWKTYSQLLGGLGTTKAKKPHAFLNWLAKHNAALPPAHKIVYVSQINADLLSDWRQSWKMRMSTRKARWGGARSFFHFIHARGWISENPAQGVSRLTGDDGRTSGTGIFSDQEWDRFVRACPDQRTRTFFEVLRWGAMSVCDAVLFQPGCVDASGVLKYQRHKLRSKTTAGRAATRLPAHVVEMLSSLPKHGQPFLVRPELNGAIKVWRVLFEKICKKAGITAIRTERGTQKPHLHALRDTQAVYLLKNGVPLWVVSRVLGHNNTKITEQHYLPFCSELQHAQLEHLDMALAKINSQVQVAEEQRVTIQ